MIEVQDTCSRSNRPNHPKANVFGWAPRCPVTTSCRPDISRRTEVSGTAEYAYVTRPRYIGAAINWHWGAIVVYITIFGPAKDIPEHIIQSPWVRLIRP